MLISALVVVYLNPPLYVYRAYFFTNQRIQDNIRTTHHRSCPLLITPELGRLIRALHNVQTVTEYL